MKPVRVIVALVLVASLALFVVPRPPADAQGQVIKLGVLYDHTGPFSAAGSLNGWRGTKMAIDYVNEHGGVQGKYKVVQVDADSQSKAEVAINEAERLFDVEKVNALVGVFSSAHAVPLAEKLDKQKKIFWITIAVSDAVFQGRNLHYVFRAQPGSGLYGEMSVAYLETYAQDKFKKAPKDLRIAIIYEDGPYGTGIATSNDAAAKKRGMQVVLKEGYSAAAPDLSSLVTKLRAARPDAILHTGYNPDIALFLRQAREQGLRVKAYIGHGAGHSQLDKLKEAVGDKEVEGFHTVDPPAAQLIDAKKLKPGVGDVTQEMVRRFRKEFGQGPIAPHVSMGFNNTWIFLNDVLPRAIQKHGGLSPDAIAAAARETDIPEGGTIQGYGVKFYPPGHPMAGQSERAFLAVYQVLDGDFKIVYPKSVAAVAPPVLLPASSPFAAR